MTSAEERLFKCSTLGDAVKFLYDAKRGERPRFSLRSFARLLDVSPSLLSKTILGHRSLSRTLIHKIGRTLELEKNEISFLLLLAERATTKDGARLPEIDSALEKYRRSKAKRVFKGDSAFLFESQIVLEALQLEGSRAAPAEIAKHVDLPMLRVKETLEYLASLEVVKKLTNGAYAPTPGEFTFHGEKPSESYREFYRLLLERSRGIIDGKVPGRPNPIGAQMIAVDPEQIPLIDREIDRFFRRIREIADASEKKTEIYSGFLHYFPLGREKI